MQNWKARCHVAIGERAKAFVSRLRQAALEGVSGWGWRVSSPQHEWAVPAPAGHRSALAEAFWPLWRISLDPASLQMPTWIYLFTLPNWAATSFKIRTGNWASNRFAFLWMKILIHIWLKDQRLAFMHDFTIFTQK